jgi:hypothetical protein
MPAGGEVSIDNVSFPFSFNKTMQHEQQDYLMQIENPISIKTFVQ